MTPAPAPRQHVWLLLGSTAAIVALTALATLIGAYPWPRPDRAMTSFWQVADVPAALWGLLLAAALVCVAAAVALIARGPVLGAHRPLVVAWVGLLVVAAAALVWHSLYTAALSATSYGALIPIFGWLFTFVPALLAAALFGRRNRWVRWVASLGTGVVTVPLFHLSWVLLIPLDRPPEALLYSLDLTVTLGVIPLVIGVLLAGAVAERPAERVT